MLLNIEPTGDKKDPWEIIFFSGNIYARDPVTKNNVSGVLVIQVTTKHDSAPLKDSMSSTIRGCKRSNVHDSVIEKHQSFS